MDPTMRSATVVTVLVGAAVLLYAVWSGAESPSPLALTEYHFRCTVCGRELVLSPGQAREQDEMGGIVCCDGHPAAPAAPMLRCTPCGRWFDRPEDTRLPVCPYCGNGSRMRRPLSLREARRQGRASGEGLGRGPDGAAGE